MYVSKTGIFDSNVYAHAFCQYGGYGPKEYKLMCYMLVFHRSGHSGKCESIIARDQFQFNGSEYRLESEQFCMCEEQIHRLARACSERGLI